MAGFYGNLAAKTGSDDGSQISDVDPAEMAKMLEGLDDLDADLFGSSLKNQKGKSLPSPTAQAKSAVKSSPDSKPRVTFNEKHDGKSSARKSQSFSDFDMDDPLAGLLSDDDSEGKKKSKRASPARTIPAVSSQEQQGTTTNKEKKFRSKSVADLFGLADEDDEENDKGSVSNSKAEKLENLSAPKAKFPTSDADLSNIRASPVRSAKKDNVTDKSIVNPISRSRSEGLKFDDGDDILDDMGFGGDKSRTSRQDKTVAKSSLVRPKSVIEELLGKRPSEKEESKPTEEKGSLNKSRGDSGVSFGEYLPTVSANREGRRSSRRNTTAIGDPLGLFSPPATPQRHSFQEGMGDKYGLDTSPAKARSSAFPDWLGDSTGDSLSPHHRTQGQSLETVPRGRHSTKENSASFQAAQKGVSIPEDDDLPEWLGGGKGKKKNMPIETPSHAQPSSVPEDPVSAPVVRPNSVVGELFVNSQFEQQAMLALQRQEAALLAAAGLKAQEAQLSEVQRRQKLLLEQQETQLKQLVERQVERQRQLEEMLRAQQERIASHMQALLAEPPGIVVLEPQKVLSTLPPPNDAPVPVLPTVTEQSSESAPSQQLMCVSVETDPVNNEELVETQAALQKCEMQKTYLEAKLENLEAKHKEEVQLLEDCYKRQMSILEEAIEKQEARLRAENQRLEADYKNRILKMQELHSQLVEEHGRQLTLLQQERLADLQKLREQQHAMLDHVQQTQKAETLAIRDASEHMTSLQSTVEILSRSAGGLGELQGKLEEQQRQQNNARVEALRAKEEELRALQEQIGQQQEFVEKENRRLKGLEETLLKDRHDLDDERQNLRSKVEKLQVERQRFESERLQLEGMKLSMLEEQKAWRQQFTEERTSLAAEKSRLETIARLQNVSTKQDEVTQLKAEAEAQLAVAREAAERAQLERASLKEQQRRLDSERRRLTEMEHDLTIRAREVEGLAQIANSTRNDGVEALAVATRMERAQAEQAAELERQLRDLQEREKRLTQEKLTLSQERMTLRKSRDQRCSNCRGLLIQQSNSPDRSRAASISLSEKFVDPKLVIMKLAAEREREALESNLSILHSISK